MTAFQIDYTDNVATALEPLEPGRVVLRGDASEPTIEAVTEVPAGHKIALRQIESGEDIVKYGVVIGRAVEQIPKGSWVHLHNIRSIYDERSSHLDAVTGAPKDTRYE
ncbi:MAG: UxaA family hydrolase [Lachnospiraceae bacterium]|nr:UxaA family hydrolase [Lachnospiraceae bacterium]